LQAVAGDSASESVLRGVTANVDDDLLNQGIAALKAGRRGDARTLLARLLQRDGQNEAAWLWLSGAVDTDEERRRCLERVLEINPHNHLAKRGLEALSGGAASPPANQPASPAGRAATSPKRSTQDRQSRLLITIGVIMVAAACMLGIVALASSLRQVPETGPLQETPYVIVYGRQSCSVTRQTIDGLERAGIPYTFKSVDEGDVVQELHPRMRAADLLGDNGYDLPVVDVSGTLMIRPSLSTVLSLYSTF
jgi:hypothetical protein